MAHNSLESFQQDLALALQLAEESCKQIMQVRATGIHPEIKGDGTPVTAADKASDRVIRGGLLRERPNDAILCEESGYTSGTSGHVWFIDPLDGTKDFVAGSDDFSVMIGLCIPRAEYEQLCREHPEIINKYDTPDFADRPLEPIMGVVAAPALHRTWYALGGEIFERANDVDTKLTPAPSQTPPRILLSASNLRAEAVAAVNAINGKYIQHGSVGVKLGRLAAGEADAYLHPSSGTHLWDCCAPEALARGFGVPYTRADRKPIFYDPTSTPNPKGICTGDPAIYDQLLTALAKIL